MIVGAPLKSFPGPLTSAEEKEYVKRLENGDRSARNVLIERNLRLVAHIVKKYSQGERDTEDMLSIGTVGLIKAVDSYNSGRGSKISTYAAKCIENEILMQLRSDRKRKREISLSSPIGTDKEGNEIHLVDVIEGRESDIVEQLYQEILLGKLGQMVCTVLTDRERKILCLRYGLKDGEEMTQREVAEQMGISRSYVSRIEKRALEKLRECLTSGDSGIAQKKGVW